MTTISIILSGLALLAALALFAWNITEKKRSLKRNAALLEYIDRRLAECMTAVKALEDGVSPNYEEAKKAADAVNAFNRGISSILDFDPYAALQRERQKEQMGGEVTDG